MNEKEIKQIGLNKPFFDVMFKALTKVIPKLEPPERRKKFSPDYLRSKNADTRKNSKQTNKR